jgi:phage FluMu protein Com
MYEDKFNLKFVGAKRFSSDARMCPRCSSINTVTDSLEEKDGKLMQPIFCNSCNKLFHKIYRLEGFYRYKYKKIDK